MKKLTMVIAIFVAIFCFFYSQKGVGAAPDFEAIKASKVVQVNLYFEGSAKPTVHVVEGAKYQQFVYATLRLHYIPGINPHNKAKTRPIRKISIKYLSEQGPFWWTTPDLKLNSDPSGAKIYLWSANIVIFNKDKNIIPPFFTNSGIGNL